MDTSNKPRVLVIDDEPSILKVTARILDKAGYETSISDNPDEALDLIALGVNFDVVLCDRCMPGMTGPELQEAASAWSPALAKRFVWMTGYDLGAAEPFLAKPFTSEQAEAALEAAKRR